MKEKEELMEVEPEPETYNQLLANSINLFDGIAFYAALPSSFL